MATTIFNASSALLDCPRARAKMVASRSVGLRAAKKSSEPGFLRRARGPIRLCSSRLGLRSLRAIHRSDERDHKKIWEDFSGEKALAHVQAMVDFGPRPPGTEAIEKTRTYLVSQLEAAGWKVERQDFSEETPRGKSAVRQLDRDLWSEAIQAVFPRLLALRHENFRQGALRRRERWRFEHRRPAGAGAGPGGTSRARPKIELAFLRWRRSL